MKNIHIICDIVYKDTNKNIEELMDKSIKKVNELNVVNKFKHTFNPIGLSLIYVLSESHISIHTWEEYNSINIDMFTCGNINPENTLNEFLSNFEIIQENKQIINRTHFEEIQ